MNSKWSVAPPQSWVFNMSHFQCLRGFLFFGAIEKIVLAL
jgi:hypothetical protein